MHRQGVASGCREPNVMTAAPQSARQEIADLGIVVDQQNIRHSQRLGCYRYHAHNFLTEGFDDRTHWRAPLAQGNFRRLNSDAFEGDRETEASSD
jgi:hypothetical protein